MGFAQKPNLSLRFTHININSGLSSNKTTAIFQDRDGFLWFGTEDGLNRFDGLEIKQYKYNPIQQNSLSGNIISNIAEADEHNLWISTHCWGLSKFNKHTVTSERFEAGTLSGLTDNCDIAVVGYYRDQVLVKNKFAISIYDKKKNQFSTLYRVPNDSSIIYGAVVSENELWLGLQGLVKSINLRTEKVTNYNFNKISEKNLYKPQFISNDGNIFFGSWKAGLLVYNIHSKQKTYLLNNEFVNDVKVVDVKGKSQLWVATGSGLYITNYGNLRLLTNASFENVKHEATNAESLASNDIRYIYQDAEKNIWLGTGDRGVEKLNPNVLTTKTYKFPEHVFADKLGMYNPNHFFIDKASDNKTYYWLSYWHGNGLVKTDSAFNIMKRISATGKEGFQKNKTENVSAVFRYGVDTICIVAWNGIWLYNDANNQFIKRLANTELYKHGQEKLKYEYAVATPDGDIWISTYNQDVQKVNSNTGKWTIYPTGPPPFHSKFKRASYLLLDRKKRLWFSDISYYRFDIQRFTHFNTQLIASDILEDSKGNVWIATAAGVGKLDEVKKRFSFYTENEGLKTGAVGKLLEDTSGNIWALSQNNLTCIHPTTKLVLNFNASDGLPQAMNPNFFYKMNSSKFLISDETISNQKRFIEFNPADLLRKSSVFFFHFTGVKIFNKLYPAEKGIEQLNQLKLQYSDNYFSISFKRLQFITNTQPHYRYRLNKKQNWVDIGTQSLITFVGLKAGVYNLEVQSSNSPEKWDDRTIGLQIIIQPPFWERTWFYLLLLLSIGVTVFFIVSRRVQAIKRKAAINLQITELELKALKAQMNPHFIFNCLSSIQESIINNKNEEASLYLGKFSKLIRMVLMQSNKNTISIGEEIEYLRIYLELESFRFSDLNFSITSSVEDMNYVHIPTMLIQPFIENSVKHAFQHKQGQKLITIDFKSPTIGLIEIILEDNGIGRAASKKNKKQDAEYVSLGLKITEERMAMLGITYSIKDLQNEIGEGVGTRIEILVKHEIEIDD